MVSRKMEDRRSAWKSICVSYAVRCIADRSWSFFLPLYLSRGCGSSLRPTAALSLTQNLAVATLSTGAADLYQSMQAERNNLDAFLRVTIIENVAVVLGGLLLVSFAAEASTDQDLCGTPLRSHVYLLALVCGSIDAICSSLLSTVISKQWVATLFHRTGAAQDDDGEQKADRDGSADLSSANATLSQIDLIVATICPLLVSTVIRYGGGYTTVLSLLVGQHAFGAVLIVASVQRALRLQPQLGVASTKKESRAQSLWMANPLSIFRDTVVPLKAKMVTAAFVLLYCTVLSPGSMLNAWLNSIRQQNQGIVSEQVIALFGSTSNLFGALATLVTPPLIKWFGIYKAGNLLQFAQAACVVCAAVTFAFVSQSSGTLLVWGFLFPLAISRVGLWGFDLVERQILQETVPMERQTVFFNTERGLTQLVSLGIMYLCYVFSDPASFGILVAVSATAVVSASGILALSTMVN